MTLQDQLVAWLDDAYAIEMGLIPILHHHAKDAKNYPAMQRRIEQHAVETRHHAELVKECLQRLGRNPSMVKQGLARLFGNVEAPMTAVFKDELLKNAVMDFASENLEIAQYEAIITLAEDGGEDEVVNVCRRILQDEQAMAEWLRSHLPDLVRALERKVTQDNVA